MNLLGLLFAIFVRYFENVYKDLFEYLKMQRRHKNCKIQKGTREEVISLIIKSEKIGKRTTASRIIHNVQIRKTLPTCNKSVASRPIGPEVVDIHI